jgi:Fe2+ or Zn2+ uptake regulation protein
MNNVKILTKSNEKDWRLTSQRLVILDFLRKTNSHPTAEQIFGIVKKRLPSISFGTVYRGLHFLKARGFIKECVINNVSRFEGRVDSHIHFVCDNCKRVFDIEGEKVAALAKRLVGKRNFFVRYENLEIGGYCADCQKKMSVRKEVPELFCMACGELLDDLKTDAPVCKACCFKTNCNYYPKTTNKKINLNNHKSHAFPGNK